MRLRDISINNLRRRKGKVLFLILGLTGIKGGGISMDLVLAVGVVLLSVAMGILSSIYPAIHASKMDPTAALRAL
ncbi:MAG: hypothetical protein A2157_00100 [Deltaproteobacteria bacterium RBG_16_47_11]|nr:MAG: hypothetical protein A2157_00100 [Deltaproteobacteria bacterium RBG_16_47_11]